MTTDIQTNGHAIAPVDEAAFQPITLHRIETQRAEIPVTGITPLIPHAWSDKARRMMLDKQQGKAAKKHAPKKPEEEAKAATYWIAKDVVGMPATAFKGAIADAARFFGKSVTMEDLKRSIFVIGEGDQQLVRIEGTRSLREDTPRISHNTADLRYRYQVFPWTATLEVEFVKSLLTLETVVTLVDAAGRNGVGDWRPSSPKSKTGTYGQFRVDES